jgi:alpha-methylacyl-CoA racemase
MLLADLGAEVVRIDRPEGNGWANPVVDRGRHVITIDVRTDAGRSLCLEAADKADVVIEGMRPGVMERLGLGPETMIERNPRLVYARMTGWGQTGPLAQVAGHDINFIALAGALAAIGPGTGSSVPPLNLVGDFGGGSMFLAFGIMAALWERERSGKGQVIDCAIVDGVASMMTMFAGLIPSGAISIDRGHSLLGGAAPFYRCFTCADGAEVAVGPLEPKFYRELLSRIGAPAELCDGQYEKNNWTERSNILAALFGTKTRSQWCGCLFCAGPHSCGIATKFASPSQTDLRGSGRYVSGRSGAEIFTHAGQDWPIRLGRGIATKLGCTRRAAQLERPHACRQDHSTQPPVKRK